MSNPNHIDIPDDGIEKSRGSTKTRTGLTAAIVAGLCITGVVVTDSEKQVNKSVLTSSLIDTMSDDEIIEKIQDLDTNWVQTLTSEEQTRVAERLLDRIPHLQFIENIELRDKILAVMHQSIDSENSK
ncbi:hypothetical protein KBB89_02055 [Candidatus Gracilibacteria bacterium]|nr:hypothetical protein [Candidatus Gracilibacteria bacterium]